MKGWKETTISDMAMAFSGYAFSASDLVSEGIPVLKIGNIQSNRVNPVVNSYFNGMVSERLSKYLLQDEDFLIAITGAGSVGRSGRMFGKTTDYLVNQRVAIVRGKGACNNRFLYYWFTMPYVEKYLYSLGIGAGQPNISAKDILKLKLLAPNKETQRKIADILSAYDDLIEANNRRIELLEQVAQELYKEWFVRFRFPGHENTKFENGLPVGWEVKKVKEIVKRKPFGRLYKEADLLMDGTVIVIDQSRNDYIGFHNNEPSHVASIDNPIALFGDHSCKYKLMITPFSLSENVVPFIGEKGVLTMYLFYLLNGLVETTEYKRHWTELMSKKVLIADLKLQQKFADYVSNILLMVETLSKNNRNLTTQREMLLPRLMSGKLEV